MLGIHIVLQSNERRYSVKQKIVILLGVFCMVFGPASAAANKQGLRHKENLSDTRAGLQLSIRLDGESFRLDDVATLKITLRNVSQTPITIYRKFGWGPSSSFIFSIS